MSLLKKKDLKIIIPIAVLALILLILSQALPRENKQANAGALMTAAIETREPGPGPAPTAGDPLPETSPGASPIPTLVPARAYLKVQIDSFVFEPLALTENRDLDLTQPDGKKNVVRITPDSIIMHSANCDNQDKRVLQNMIVCLPNQVVLQLLDPQEALIDWETAHGPLPEAPRP